MPDSISVAPRFDVKSKEKIDGFIGIGELMVKDVRNRPLHLMNIIEDVSGVPSFDIDDHGNVLGTSKPTMPKNYEEEKTQPVYVEDCTAGCGQRGTVIPLNSSLSDWQCKNCGKQYKQK